LRGYFKCIAGAVWEKIVTAVTALVINGRRRLFVANNFLTCRDPNLNCRIIILLGWNSFQCFNYATLFILSKGAAI